MCTNVYKVAQVDFRRMSRARKGPIRVIQVAIGGDHIILLAHCCGEATVFAAGMKTYTCSRMEHLSVCVSALHVFEIENLGCIEYKWLSPLWRHCSMIYLHQCGESIQSLWRVMAHVSGPAQSIELWLSRDMQDWDHAVASAFPILCAL